MIRRNHCWRRDNWWIRYKCNRNGHETDYLPCSFGCVHCRRCGKPMFKPDPDKEIERWTNIKNGIMQADEIAGAVEVWTGHRND